MKKEKTCLECGETLVGRADKKFCDDQCRSNYNNKANIAGTEGKAKISKQKLSDKGFNFKYHTHQHQTQKGSVYKLCYDYGYLPIENDLIYIIKWGNFTPQQEGK